MTEMPEFREFQKIPRYSRDIIITEKIDGTNAQIFIDETLTNIYAGSRNRFLTIENDNFGFAKWVNENKEELLKLGKGRHFGEWWGSGIQRGYGLKNGEKRFSLFNVSRDRETVPSCVGFVPILYRGNFENALIHVCLDDLRKNGSKASPGFMNPEGIIIFHIAGNYLFKKTLEKDDEPKSKSM